MKKAHVFFLIVLLLGLIIPMFGCTLPEDENNNGNGDKWISQTLLAPDGVNIKTTDSYFLLSYNAVENVSFYKVIIRDSKGTVAKTEKLDSYSTSYAIKKDEFADGDYTITVISLGDNEKFFNSEESNAVSFKVQNKVDVPPIEFPIYYKDAQDLRGNALKSSLRTIITKTHTKITSYSDCKKYLQNADEDPNNSSNMLLFYTGESIKKTDNMNIWNREHVWAQSLGWFKTSGAGADLHHIRPCDPGVNSSRGNKKFGTGGSYYTPKDSYKGDVARIIFYLMVRYPQSDSYSFSSIAQSLDVLLAWNELDPVSVHEQNRNEYIAKIQGNRNPFIDYPAFAEMIWK